MAVAEGGGEARPAAGRRRPASALHIHKVTCLQLVAPLNGLGEVPFLGHLLPPLRAWRQPRHTLHTLAEFIVSRGPGRRGCGTAGRGLTAT